MTDALQGLSPHVNRAGRVAPAVQDITGVIVVERVAPLRAVPGTGSGMAAANEYLIEYLYGNIELPLLVEHPAQRVQRAEASLVLQGFSDQSLGQGELDAHLRIQISKIVQDVGPKPLATPNL